MHSLGYLNVQSPFLNSIVSVLKYFPGVPIFFVISGLLVHKSLERLDYNLFAYFKHRALRIFPALVPVTILGLLLLMFFQNAPIATFLSQTKLWVWFLGQISFFQFYTPDILRFWGNGTPNGSLWTITVELQFYILLPVVTYFAFKFRAGKLIFPFLILGSIVANCLLRDVYLEDNLLGKFIGVSFLPYLYFFLFGTLISIYWDKIKIYS